MKDLHLLFFAGLSWRTPDRVRVRDWLAPRNRAASGSGSRLAVHGISKKPARQVSTLLRRMLSSATNASPETIKLSVKSGQQADPGPIPSWPGRLLLGVEREWRPHAKSERALCLSPMALSSASGDYQTCCGSLTGRSRKAIQSVMPQSDRALQPGAPGRGRTKSLPIRQIRMPGLSPTG